MKELLTEEFLEKATEELNRIASQMTNEVVGIIADRLKECGTLTASDVTKLKNTMRIADFKKIEKVLSELSGKGAEEIEKIFDNVATENEVMTKVLYEYRDNPQIPYKDNKEMSKIVSAALKNAKDEFLALSKTTVLNMVVNGKILDIKKAYNKAIDNAVFAINQGVTDYTSAIRRVVKEMASNGLVVRYESGYHRRLDSAVRMNVLDGVRQMNLSMREQQAKEYGADGWEISAHALCRPDHQNAQGRVFSFKEFDDLQSTLRTPIATGEMNCKHTKVGVIMAINQPAYSKEELKKLKDSSNEKVTFTGLSGKEITKTRYECSQYMRVLETSIREKKDVKKALERVEDTLGTKKTQREVTELTKQYKRICNEMKLTPRLNRLRSYS